MVEQPRQRADHQDQRQRVERQDEAGLGTHRLERRGAAGQIAEHQAHAGVGGGLQRGDETRRPVEGGARGGDVQHHAGDEDLQADAGHHDARQPRRLDGAARSESAQAISGMAKQADQALQLE